MILHLLVLILAFFSDGFIFNPPEDLGECTIGVFSGRATADGRPMLWKNRDVTNAVQKFCYFKPDNDTDSPRYAFIGNVYSEDTTRVFMGLNDA